jgi:hypothetical protein
MSDGQDLIASKRTDEIRGHNTERMESNSAINCPAGRCQVCQMITQRGQYLSCAKNQKSQILTVTV